MYVFVELVEQHIMESVRQDYENTVTLFPCSGPVKGSREIFRTFFKCPNEPLFHPLLG